MNEIVVHPGVYATGLNRGLVPLLERLWIREHRPGDGAIFIVSGFANYNGGVRFYDVFRSHIQAGGRVVAYLGGSTAQRLTSKQVVQELLDCGVEVTLINRKRLLHAKCYGVSRPLSDSLIVTSGNFTGPGMSQNVEMSVLLDEATTSVACFAWGDLEAALRGQNWDYYAPRLDDPDAPAWKLVYDEQAADIVIDDTEEITLVITLSHSDTARINAAPGTAAGKGTQYFWLSKDSYDFFPALTIRNTRGTKATYSALVELDYVDLGVVDDQARVTFEAENNFDFRLGTRLLRFTHRASEGDMAAISRVGESRYQVRVFRKGSDEFACLSQHAVDFVGHRGKRCGFIPNARFEESLGIRISRRRGGSPRGNEPVQTQGP